MAEYCDKHGPYSVLCKECDLETIERFGNPTPQAEQVEQVALKPCPFCGGAAEVENISTSMRTDKPLWSVGCFSGMCDVEAHATDDSKDDAIRYWNTRASDQQLQVMREALPKRIGRLMLGERLSKDHYCGGSHDMPDGHPVYWQERGGEHPDDIDGYCLACAIEQAESDAGWCDCAARAALQGTPNND